MSRKLHYVLKVNFLVFNIIIFADMTERLFVITGKGDHCHDGS